MDINESRDEAVLRVQRAQLNLKDAQLNLQAAQRDLAATAVKATAVMTRLNSELDGEVA